MSDLFGFDHPQTPTVRKARVSLEQKREKNRARLLKRRIRKAAQEGRELKRIAPKADSAADRRKRKNELKRAARAAKAEASGRRLILRGLHNAHVSLYHRATVVKPTKPTKHDAHVVLWRSDSARIGRWKYNHVPSYAMYHRLKRWMHKHLGCDLPSRKWAKKLGYTADDLRSHLERQFLPRMGWHNKGEWHIDHIIPVSAFQHLADDESEFLACFGLHNLRPVWKKVNLSKGSRREFLI